MKEKPSQLISKWLKTGDKTVAIRYMSYFIIAILIFGFCGYAELLMDTYLVVTIQLLLWRSI